MAKTGGTLILVMPCTEGPGSKVDRNRFRQEVAMATDQLMALIREGRVSASSGVCRHSYAKAIRKARIVLVSDNFSESEAQDLGIGYAKSVQEGVDNSLAEIGKEAQVGVLSVGGLAVPETSLFL